MNFSFCFYIDFKIEIDRGLIRGVSNEFREIQKFGVLKLGFFSIQSQVFQMLSFIERNLPFSPCNPFIPINPWNPLSPTSPTSPLSPLQRKII